MFWVLKQWRKCSSVERKMATKQKTKKNLPLILSTFGAVVIFFILCWYAYSYYHQQNNINNIIHIKADTSPIKVLPDDPGGMKVEHKDKNIYGRIIGAEEKIPAKVKIIEDVDQTSKEEIIEMATRQSKDGLESQNSGSDYQITSIGHNVRANDKLGSLIEDISSEVEGSDKKAKEYVSPKSLEQTLLEQTNDKAEENEENTNVEPSSFEIKKQVSENVAKLSRIRVFKKPEIKVNLAGFDNAKVTIESDKNTGKRKTKIKLADVPKSMKKSSSNLVRKTGAGYYVQISSHTSMADLEDAWNDFKRKYSSFVANSSRNVTNASVSGKKYFRLSFGPFSSKNTASLKCGALKQKGKDCLIKKY